MPASLQVYLLRVLETGHLVRLGGIAEIPVDVRIVAATHRAGGPEGGLRSDLYYRLARYPITLPPLRARGRDIGLLAQRFVEAMNRETGNSKVLASDCITALEQYSWPGNVRELRAATEYAYLRQEGREAHVMPMQRLPEVTDTDELRFQVGMTFQEVQDRLLDRTLAFHQGDKTAAARSLGVSVRTIHNHLARRRSC
jgi:transcriptional regulator with PAS, ATPase and Fis domain